jgi:hypothetical protein
MTTTQAKLLSDYCAVCGGNDAGACATQANNNFNFAQYSDTVAAMIDSKCVPDSGAGCAGFLGCLFNTVGALLPPNPCADAGGD